MRKTKKRARASKPDKLNNAVLFLITLMTVLTVGGIVLAAVVYPGYAEKKAKDEYAEIAPVSISIEETEEPEAARENVQENAVLGANINNERYYNIINDPGYMAANNIYTRSALSPDTVTLCFSGDILFDDEYAVTATLKQRGGALSEGISDELLKIMKEADITVVNNEFPYTERGSATPEKQFTFRADYSTAYYLNDMGADVAILANNHVYDFGEQGLLDTLDTVRSVGVVPVGAGRNIDEASKPAYFIVNDIKIAIVAATQIERNDSPNTIGATENRAGTFRCWTGDLIYEKIAEAKANADFVIVCVHWGTEKESEPDYYQLKQAPLLAEAGADLIIGDHPHVLQGITYYGDTPCIYSLGNFWFNSSTLDTGMVQVAIDKNGLQSFRFIPAVQSDCRTYPVSGAQSDRILNNMRSLSPGVSIDENGMVSKR